MAELMSGRVRWLCGMLIVVAAASGCQRQDRTPSAQSQTASPVQTTNTSTTVTGCLRAGDASDTFVLTTARTTDGETATYQLHPIPGIQLAEHVGRQVEVNGVLRARQEVSTSSSTQPAGKPTGTAGTPKVSTSTELEVRQLEVQQVRPVGERCPDERK